MPTYLTSNRHGYNVRFSPFDANRLLVASSQLFGLAGGGTLYLLELGGSDDISEVKRFEWSDGLFDVVWSEQDEHIGLSASGDGSLQLWNLATAESDFNGKPVQCFHEHGSEVYSVDWCEARFDRKFLSASWDCSIKLWDPNRISSIVTYTNGSELLFNARFSPHIPHIFASVGSDGYLKLWNSLENPLKPVKGVSVHSGEVLTCDWSKHDCNLIATGASDGLIRGWDIRNFQSPIFELIDCEFAIRRIKFSPFSPSVLVSAAYDFTTRIWDFQKSFEAIEIVRHHTEFVYGIDWNQNRINQIADCGWDSLVHVFMSQSLENT